MNRKLWLGIVMIAAIATPSASPEAAPRKTGETTFTVSWEQEQPTLRAEGRGVKFFKRIGRDRVFIRVEVPGDAIDLEADVRGAIRVGRKGKSVAFQTKDSFDASIAKVQKLTAGSDALNRFEGLVASLAFSDTQNVQSLRSSHALINAVRGVTIPLVTPPAPTANRPLTLARATTSFREEVPSACWAEYASTVNQYNVIFNDCIADYWWIPGWTAACGLQFAIQSELAWFWLISCSGGMPV